MAVYRRKDTKSKRWFYKFKIDGVTYKRAIPTARTKRQAEEAERRARQDVHDGCYEAQRANMAFAEFAQKVFLPWAEQNHRAYERDKIMCEAFSEYFKGYSLRQMSLLAIDGYKQKRAKARTQYGKPFSPSTVNLELDILSGILTLAVKHKYLRENPCQKVTRLPVTDEPCRYLLPDEEAALMKQLESDRAFLKPLVIVALSTGLRQCELLALRKTSVDFARNRLFVTNPKWKKDPRRLKGNPMNEDTRRVLLELARTVPGEHFFVNDITGKPLTGAH